MDVKKKRLAFYHTETVPVRNSMAQRSNPPRKAEAAKNQQMAETFLIGNATQMHQEALTENRVSLKNWEGFLRQSIFTDQRYGLITRLLYSYPQRHKTSVRLNQVFPVLEGAEITAQKDAFFANKTIPIKFRSLDNVQLYFSTVFNTRHHGHVNLIGVGVLPSETMRYRCRLQMGTLVAINSDDPIESESGNLTLSMTNLSDDPEARFHFMVTMLVPFNGCTHCHRAGKTTAPTRVQMLKCGRCWERLHFPVWYCCAECQRADLSRHRTEEGCGGRRKE
jgi:hypothetical protein